MPTRADVNKVFKFNPSQGVFQLERWRRAIKPYWLYSNLETGAITVPAAGTGYSSFRPEGSSNQGLDEALRTPFLWQTYLFEDSTDTTALANFLIDLQEDGTKRKLMNRPQHVRNIAGVAQTPFVLREPLLIDSNASLLQRVTKVAGGAASVRMFLAGSRYYPWSSDLIVEPNGKATIMDEIRRWSRRNEIFTPYWVTPDQDVSLSGDATTDYYYKQPEDSCFEIFGWAFVSTGAFSIIVQETRTRQRLMTSTVTSTNSIGTANFPGIFPTTYLLFPGYRLQFRITDLSGSSNTIYLTLFGRRIYAMPKDVEEADYDLSVDSPAPPGYTRRVLPTVPVQAPRKAEVM